MNRVLASTDRSAVPLAAGFLALSVLAAHHMGRDDERSVLDIYRRLTWDDLSISIGHYRKSMLVHPHQQRGLSLGEASRLQSLPDWFRFSGSANGNGGGLVHKQQQLPNAVCLLVMKAIGEFILTL